MKLRARLRALNLIQIDQIPLDSKRNTNDMIFEHTNLIMLHIHYLTIRQISFYPEQEI